MEFVLMYFGIIKYMIYFQAFMPTYAFGNVSFYQ